MTFKSSEFVFNCALLQFIIILFIVFVVFIIVIIIVHL